MRMTARIVSAMAASAVAMAAAGAPALAEGAAQSMHRLYNPYSGEHFYTASAHERDSLVGVGWSYEGVGWVAPAEGEPVFRLYNPYSGDHHYTTSAGERDALLSAGWRDEGVGWRSGGEVAVLRQYNPYARTATHNYTASAHERDALVSAGWRDEGVGWHGVRPTADDGHEHAWEERTVVDQSAWDEPTYGEEPVYEKKEVAVCGGCGAVFDGGGDAQKAAQECGIHACDVCDSSYHWEWRQVQVGTRKVQTGSIHHDAVTHVERRCALCGAVG